MAWTAPRTYVAGEVITAAIGNAQWRDNERYLKGLDGDVTIEDDIELAANMVKFTDVAIDREDATGVAVRNTADDAYRSIMADDSEVHGSVLFQTDAEAIAAPNADDDYTEIQARRNATGLVAVARLEGAAQPRLQHILPLNLEASAELTIAAGVITAGVASGAAWYTVDTQADDAADDLDTINGGQIGDRIVLTPEDAARVVTVKHSTGNIELADGVDFAMSDAQDSIELMWNGTFWHQPGRTQVDISTKEEWINPLTFVTNATWGKVSNETAIVQLDATSEVVYGRLLVKADFNTLTSFEAVFNVNANGTVDWTQNTDFGGSGEDFDTHQDTATADTQAVVAKKNLFLDVSDSLTGVAAGDVVNMAFNIDNFDTTVVVYFMGWRFKYT